MWKNFFKCLAIIISVAAIIGVIVYFLQKYREDTLFEEDFFDEDDFEDFVVE